MVRGHLQRYHHVPRSRITVIPNAIDADRLQVAQPGAVRCAFRNGVGLEPDDLVGLFVGHNYWLKGLKPLLTALARRKEDFPAARPIHLLVCGAGKAAPIRRMARRLGLEGTVHLAGFVPDIRACYWSSDFFVSPTYYDPCSLAVLEALACGLPAITTACNGAGELMTNGREGFVIPAPDALDELAGAIGAMTDDAARRRMAEHAARLGRAHTFDHHVDAARSGLRGGGRHQVTPRPSCGDLEVDIDFAGRSERWSRPSKRERTRDDMKAVLLAGGRGPGCARSPTSSPSR